jgi:hypothetical protein
MKVREKCIYVKKPEGIQIRNSKRSLPSFEVHISALVSYMAANFHRLSIWWSVALLGSHLSVPIAVTCTNVSRVQLHLCEMYIRSNNHRLTWTSIVNRTGATPETKHNCNILWCLKEFCCNNWTADILKVYWLQFEVLDSMVNNQFFSDVTPFSW